MEETEICRYVTPGSVRLPPFVPVDQRFATEEIADVRAAVHAEIERIAATSLIPRGGRVAVTAGSRGIARIAEITRTVVDEVRACGGDPFVVPAMGSHGGATAEGQIHVLHEYGITEATMGCPIRSSMDAVELGQTPSGYRVFCDRNALESDGIVVVNRVKPHSILTGDLGSGLMKMLGIGLGKQVGADAIHVKGIAENLLPSARIVLAKSPVLFGLAIVENPFDRPYRIEAALPSDIESTDLRLLRLARSLLPGIPFDPLDVLVVERIGKDISGAGMDPNVIGMHRRIGGPPQREIRRIVALDLTPASSGNAIGVGMADIITERLRAKIDFHATYVNALTSDFLWGIKLPLAAATDQEAIELAFRPFPPETVRAVRILDTAHLDRLWVTPALLPEAEANPRLDLASPAADLGFDIEGALRNPWGKGAG